MIRKNRELFVMILVIFVIAVGGSLFLRWSQQREPISYSSYSAGQEGVKGAYLLLEKLGFSVARSNGNLDDLGSESVLILIEPQLSYKKKDEELKHLNQWVYEGHTMVIVGNYQKYFMFSSDEKKDTDLEKLAAFRFPEDHDKKYYDGHYGKGTFRLIPDMRLFLNGGLRQEGNASALAATLWDFEDRKMFFSEYGGALLLGQNKRWENSPITLLNTTWKFILLQIMIGFIIFAFFTNKRLGIPDIYREETMRSENEDVQAFAGLMMQTGLSNDAAVLYYRRFEEEASAYFKTTVSGNGELLEQLWKTHGLKHFAVLQAVRRQMLSNNKNEKRHGNEMIDIFQNIDMLREEIVNNE
ncbi:DUF4350 domain-containing protein [Petroclostridium sp. X23]|uniref:DUF4350 domain-containing protein n=1 Tax=Petroclostridium sp. X23 TaxID=3045146 RepID=UPI0024AE7B52|nr:DUF4350 domain-containing protein [Petroclostridium sp. X23]WHH58111.1 DUF4350 domain-containing protein [Petroclostridium sp. X23]